MKRCFSYFVILLLLSCNNEPKRFHEQSTIIDSTKEHLKIKRKSQLPTFSFEITNSNINQYIHPEKDL
jgi:tRNA A37 threonylcarbamoyladenosine synthetase subunit TsaC/SUA5/YrdC